MTGAAPGAAGLQAWQEASGTGRARLRRVDAGEALFRQGQPVAALYRVQSGQIRLVRYLEDGTSVVLHVARPGETFAEASAFSDVYHCDAVAERPSEVAVVPKADFIASLASDAEARLGFAQLLAAQVRDLRARAELRSIRSAPERILAWLRMRASGNPPAVDIDRTWAEIAAELGLTREAVYRTLAALERDGRIIRGGGTVTLGS